MFLHGLQSASPQLIVKPYETPFGTYTLKCSQRGVFWFKPRQVGDHEFSNGNLAKMIGDHICGWLDSYFDGKPLDVKIPIDLEGKTPFQKLVYNELLQIPYGQVTAYNQVATNIGYGCNKAIGQACSKNDILIIIPCHRVLGTNGDLTGFAAGVETKQKLLEMEQFQRHC